MFKFKRRLYLAALLVVALSSASWFTIFLLDSSEQSTHYHHKHHSNFRLSTSPPPPPPPPPPPQPQISTPYHNWRIFSADFQDMIQNFKIYIYPTNSNASFASFATIFLPHQNPSDPKIGNYFSEHMFKLSLLNSSLITTNPQKAHLFFLPFSVNLLRNDPRVHSETSIADFVARYAAAVRRDFPFWNASSGADHFYACCHSVCREACSHDFGLRNNAIQLTCSSSYFQRLYATHKDVALPQVWPRLPQPSLNPPHKRCHFDHSL